MTAPAAPVGQCRVCGRDWPLAPGGLLVRHPRQQPAVFAKNCPGSRQQPDDTEKETT